jgi:putative hemolysin
MFDVAFELLVIFLLILVNGVFAMSETAVVTARKSWLEEWAGKGNARARAALELANGPNRFLSTVQIVITLAGVLAGALGARTLAERLAVSLSAVPALEGYSQGIALGLVVIGITYLFLIVGERVPKRIAQAHAEGIATFVALPMRALSSVAHPAIRLLRLSTAAVLGSVTRRAAPEPSVTEEKIKMMVQQGAEAGVVHESEQDMVEAVFRLGDKTARALMTPRSQIAWLDLDAPYQETRQKIAESGFSRFPVGEESLDKVLGIVQAKDLLSAALAGHDFDLRASLQQPIFVPRSAPALQVVELFKESGKHIALVVDEYGGIEGLLTHHDILEAIAGEIRFGEGAAHSSAIEREDGSWLLEGMLPEEEFKEIFDLESLPGEKRDAYQTLGGFLFTQMGRVPSVSDHLEWGRLRFEIVDMDGKRIDKVLVSPVEPGSDRGKGG